MLTIGSFDQHVDRLMNQLLQCFSRQLLSGLKYGYVHMSLIGPEILKSTFLRDWTNDCAQN